MFVLSALAVFSCAKIVELVLFQKKIKASWVNEVRDTHQLNSSFQVLSQARSLRAFVQARGSCASWF